MSNELEAPKSRVGLIAIIIAVVVALIAGGYFLLRDSDNAGDEDLVTVRLGTVGAGDPYWEVFKEAALAEGINLEIVDYADYPQPNPALDEGAIDINQFQHIIFLAQHVANTGSDIVPIGSTAIYPLGLYSKQYDAVADIPDGSTIAIPDDPSNRARALLVLQSAGLLTLDGGGTIFSTPAEIDAANSRVSIVELPAEQTARSLDDYEAAIINNNYVENASLAPSDAIAQDDPNDPNSFPYVNIFAVRAADVDNETYLKLVEIYQETQAILDGVQDTSGGTAVFVKVSIDELKKSLDDTVELVKNN